MSRILVGALGAVILVALGEYDLHIRGSIVEGGVEVLIGGLALLVAIVLAAAYSDESV